MLVVYKLIVEATLVGKLSHHLSFEQLDGELTATCGDGDKFGFWIVVSDRVNELL